MKSVVQKIIQWHHDRNLVEGATDDGQLKKLMSEFGEYSDNLAKGRCVKDDIGDMGVVILNIAERNDCVSSVLGSPLVIGTSYSQLLYSLNDIAYYMESESSEHYRETIKETLIIAWKNLTATANLHGYTIQTCLEVAYDDIKDRKGKLINGTFVKESDL